MATVITVYLGNNYSSVASFISSISSNVPNAKVASSNVLSSNAFTVNAITSNTELQQLEAQAASIQGEINNLTSESQKLDSIISSFKQNGSAQMPSLSNTVNSISVSSITNSSYLQELQNDLANKSSEVSVMSSYLNLSGKAVLIENQTLIQPPGSLTSMSVINVDYAGYLTVEISGSYSQYANVTVSWSSYGIQYSKTENIGASGEASFPVLPSKVSISIGNTNPTHEAIENVTIIYHY